MRRGLWQIPSCQDHDRRYRLMSLHTHLIELERKHEALEREIQDAIAHPSTDDLRVVELKRRKLHLKDEINRLRSGESRTMH
jgi:hypothetical protein